MTNRTSASASFANSFFNEGSIIFRGLPFSSAQQQGVFL